MCFFTRFFFVAVIFNGCFFFVCVVFFHRWAVC